MTVESRSSSELSCTGILLLLHSLDLLLRHLSVLCFISSPLGLWDLSLYLHAIVNLVDELRLRFLNCLLRRLDVFMWGQLHHCDGLFQNQQWHLHLDDLFDDSLWDTLLARELRLRTTVFAGVVHVAQRIPWLPFV